jgi:lysophospholipase L1-like esterase
MKLPPAAGTVLVLLAAGALAGATGILHVRAPVPPAAGRPVAIMPLGDSITAGWPDMGYGGYRHRLGALLAHDGYAVRFVGSQRSGRVIPDPANEGHLGWTIPELKAGIDSRHWLETYRPDIVLLHIGTNDLDTGGAGAAPANLSALLADMLARLPDAHVIVAEIIPFQTGPDAAYDAYVAAIPGIVARDGPRVSLVDMRAILTAGDYADKLHPTTRGYDKMAGAWDTAIRQIMAESHGR